MLMSENGSDSILSVVGADRCGFAKYDPCRTLKQAILSKEAKVFQCVHSAAANVLPLCGSQCHIFCSSVLGRWHQEQWWHQA